jgi:hypothetical protein
MTVKELKDFIKDCKDTDFVTICTCSDDNPVTDYCDVGMVYKIIGINEDIAQVCIMPS